MALRDPSTRERAAAAGVTLDCFECHATGTPFFESQVTALGPAPDGEPIRRVMHEVSGYDKTKLDTWIVSFQGRTAFKWFGFAAMTVVALILFSYMMSAIPHTLSRIADRLRTKS